MQFGFDGLWPRPRFVGCSALTVVNETPASKPPMLIRFHVTYSTVLTQSDCIQLTEFVSRTSPGPRTTVRADCGVNTQTERFETGKQAALETRTNTNHLTSICRFFIGEVSCVWLQSRATCLPHHLSMIPCMTAIPPLTGFHSETHSAYRLLLIG